MPVVSASNPNDPVVEVETLSANEVISCLWSKSATEKCRIGLADIVLYDNGQPVRWYVTGKTGEVLKKKAVDLPALKERWGKICTRSGSNYYCIVRQEGGVLKFLGDDAWNSYIATNAKDQSIVSLHCYIKGSSNQIFRNKFELKDRLGRFTTSTFTYSYGQREPNKSTSDNAKPYVPEPVVVLSESRTEFVESKANSIKNIMDLATSTIVRYVENMLAVKVLSLSVDYIIDTKSQLWMMWTSDARIVRTTDIANITVPGLHPGDTEGRMKWAGNKYADDMKGMVLDGRVPGYGTQPSLSRGGSPGRMRSTRAMSPTRSSSGHGGRDTMNFGESIPAFSDGGTTSDPLAATVDDHGKVLQSKAAVQVDNAMKVVENSGSANSSRAGKKAYLQNISVIEPEEKFIDPSKTKFPDAFKCKGEYCNVRFKTSGELYSHSKNAIHLLEKCFTHKELEILRKDKNYGSMMDFSADGPGLATISQRSIILARKESAAWKRVGKLVKHGKTTRRVLVTRVKSAALALIRQTIVSLCKMHLSMKI